MASREYNLKRADEKEPPLSTMTLRLEPNLDQEIRKWCKENGYVHSSVLRAAVEIGWPLIRAKADEPPSS